MDENMVQFTPIYSKYVGCMSPNKLINQRTNRLQLQSLQVVMTSMDTLVDMNLGKPRPSFSWTLASTRHRVIQSELVDKDTIGSMA